MFKNISPLRIGLFFYFCIYIASGIYLIPFWLRSDAWRNEFYMRDYQFYEAALVKGLQGGDPYEIRAIGPGFLYPPPALFVVEGMYRLGDLDVQAGVYWVLSIGFITSMVYFTAKRYGYAFRDIWFWYVLAFFYSPFIEALQVGQINPFTIFGITGILYGTPLVAALGFNLAVLTKATPLLMVPYMWVNKQYKALAIGAAIMTFMLIITAIRFDAHTVYIYGDVFWKLLSKFPLSNNSFSLASKIENMHRYDLWGLPGEGVADVLYKNYVTVHRTFLVYHIGMILFSSWLTYKYKLPKEPLFVVSSFAMTLFPNVMWHHHLMFMFPAFLVWMGWSRLNPRVVAWLFFGLLIIQIDRHIPPYGLFVHIWGNVTMIGIVRWQILQGRQQPVVEPQRELAPA